MTRSDPSRVVRAARGNQLTARSWQMEAAVRMLMNNLDPDVAERPGRSVPTPVAWMATPPAAMVAE